MSNLSDYAEAIEQDHAGDTILQHADDLQRGAGYFRFQLEPFVTRRSRSAFLKSDCNKLLISPPMYHFTNFWRQPSTMLLIP